MVNFCKQDSLIILSYIPEYGRVNWIEDNFKQDESVVLKRTFTFNETDLLNPLSDFEIDDDEDERTYEFIFAKLDGDYYKIQRGVLLDHYDVFIHKDITVLTSYFVADPKISIISHIAKLTSEDIYIGGEVENAIPLVSYQHLIKQFPNAYEKQKYAEARISSLLRNYLETTVDAETKYLNYMNKKQGVVGTDLKFKFKELELFKNQNILEKLQLMLKSEDEYTEKQWQLEILQIILLLYPKYIYVFTSVPITDPSVGQRFLDYMLIDSSGHVDIIEIKKPFKKSIITENKYRNNFIPLRELSGTIMQLEKYIYYLNRGGSKGEVALNLKYKNDLPEGFKIKVTNPNGIIIMGREDNLTPEQKMDFEVVKRKYKNVVDIITYDSLIGRVDAMIQQIQKYSKNSMVPLSD